MSRHTKTFDGPACPALSPFLIGHGIRTGRYKVTDIGLEKRCTACDDWWPADTEFFAVQSCKPDGLSSGCKCCHAEARKRKEAA
jgi:hypothetical protein